MAISSPLSVKQISGSLRKNKKLSSGSTETIKKVQDVLVKKTKVRKEIFQNQTILQNRRSENERRRNVEDQLEASNLVIRPGGAAQLIQSSTKGFLERILGFLGYLTAGWILNNLPTWIAMGKEFIARAQRMGQLISGFVGNITNIFLGFGNLLSATYQNLVQFDLFDTSNRVKDAFGQLTGSVDEMGRELEESIKLLTTPLTEGMVSGENAPATGQDRTSEGAYEPGAPYSGIEGPETSGGRVSPQAVYSYLRSKGIGHIHAMGILANIEGESGFQIGAQEKGDSKQGVGLFQYTFPSRKQAFLQAVPDYKTNWKGQIDFAMGRDPNTPLYLNKQFSSPEEAADDFMRNWENPSKRVYNDRRRKHNQFIKSFKPGSSPQQPQPQTGQVFRPLPQGSFKGGERQRFNAPRDGGKRKHLGVDITESNWKPGSDPRIPVVAIRGGVVSSRNYVPGSQYLSGMVIDQDDGYSIRYLHMSPSVRPGQKVSAGQRIGRLVDLGNQTHLHIELYAGSKLLDPTDYIKTVERGGVPAAIARQQPAPAQIASLQTQQRQQGSQQLSRERTGPTVIISETPAPQPQVIQSGPPPSTISSPEIDEFTLLNNFMRNKLLLDLAYL
jgi:murein DD-endopeptidase MepM/ murein hydrolase activator NlpD